VIPVAASLRRHGAGRGATTAFLISTPQTGVDSIFVTYSLLGPVFAIFRPIAALISGFIGGTAVSLADGSGDGGQAAETCQAECCNPSSTRGRFARAMAYGFDTLVRDVAKPLIVGILIGGAIAAWVPRESLEPYLGGGPVAMLIALALGLPVYVCATASVPIAAAMLVAGASPGVALVFLMTGPASNAATISTIWKLMGRRTALIYLVTVALTALAAGAVLDWMVFKPGQPAMSMAHEMLPGWVLTASAVALLVLILVSLLRRPPADHDCDREHAERSTGHE